MRRLLSQTEQWLVFAGCALSLALAAILWFTEPVTLNRSAEVVAIILGQTLLAGFTSFSAWRHAHYPGQLRWLGVIWIAGLAFPLTLVAPMLINNISGSVSAYYFAGLACLAAGVVGVIRELIPSPGA